LRSDHSSTRRELSSSRPAITHVEEVQLSAASCDADGDDDYYCQKGAKAAASTAQTDEELSRLQLCELQNLGVLGQGSSGVVRKMRHLPTGRLICLKV